MFLSQRLYLIITLFALVQTTIYGMENLKEIMPYNPASSGAIGVKEARKSTRLPKYSPIKFDADQKNQLAQMKLKNKETMLNVGTAITVGIIAAPIVIYGAQEIAPLINSGASTIAQTSSDIYHFFKDSWPDLN